MVSYRRLNLLGLFDRNVGLTTKFATMKVSEKVEEDKPLSQTQVDMSIDGHKSVNR